MKPAVLLLSSSVASSRLLRDTSGNSIQHFQPLLFFLSRLNSWGNARMASYPAVLKWSEEKEQSSGKGLEVQSVIKFKMKKLLTLLFLIPIGVIAQSDSVISGVYKWNEPAVINKDIISSTVLFEGKVHDFKWMQMTANAFTSSKKKFKKKVPASEEHLLLIKSGMLTIGKEDSAWSIEKGSIALLMPGQKYNLKCEGREPCNYYVMKYSSRKRGNKARGKNAGGSLVKNFNSISFIPNTNGGGRRNFFDRPTAMTKRFEMHVTTLKEGARSHDPHTHRAEEIVLIIEGNTEMQIGDKFYKGKTGDIYYLGSDVLHAIRNVDTKPCLYFAFQFE